jgi:hypothetical protein
VQQVVDLLAMTRTEATGLLERAYSRCIVDKVVEDGATKYKISNFYARLDHFAKYENWHDIPAEARRIINRRFLDEFIGKHKHYRYKMQVLSSKFCQTIPSCC